MYNKSVSFDPKNPKLILEMGPDGVFQCDICDELFRKNHQLKNHWYSIHEKNESHQNVKVHNNPLPVISKKKIMFCQGVVSVLH